MKFISALFTILLSTTLQAGTLEGKWESTQVLAATQGGPVYLSRDASTYTA
jgi:hypothetical protein